LYANHSSKNLNSSTQSLCHTISPRVAVLNFPTIKNKDSTTLLFRQLTQKKQENTHTKTETKTNHKTIIWPWLNNEKKTQRNKLPRNCPIPVII